MNGNMQIVKQDWWLIILMMLPVFLTIWVWDQIPDSVPVHFDLAGNPDRFGSKLLTMISLPAMTFIVYLAIVYLPSIDPRRRIDNQQKSIRSMRRIITIALIVINIIVIASSSQSWNPGKWIGAGMGMLIIAIGNQLNSLKDNYFIGIRTPWTLEDRNTWRKTHRFSSRLFILIGLFIMIGSLIGLQGHTTLFLLILVGGLAIAPLLYSYLVYKQSKKI